MFTILELVLNALITSLQNFHADKGKRDRKDLGRRLVTFYYQLVDIVVVGQQILDQLENDYKWYYFGQTEPFRVSARGTKYWHQEIRRLLSLQADNLRKLEYQLTELESIMIVLMPASDLNYISVVTLRKMTVINSLATMLNGGKLPMEYFARQESLKGSEELPDRLKAVNEFVNDLVSSSVKNYESEITTDTVFIEHWKQFDIGSISITVNDNEEDVTRAVELYMKGSPSTRLSELAQLAETIRSLIISNFELDEILWSVEKSKKLDRKKG